jgi:hypothetical protein
MTTFKGFSVSVLGSFLVMFGAACGAEGDDQVNSSLALEEAGAEAVESPDYCERASSKKVHPHKVMICHIPPGNPANAHTIIVGKKAVQAHLDHGDVLGACGCDEDGLEPSEGEDHDGHEHEGDDVQDGGGTTGDGDGGTTGDGGDGGTTGDGTDSDGAFSTPLNSPSSPGAYCTNDQVTCGDSSACGSQEYCDLGCCVEVFL